MTRPVYWCIRREIWENRSIYVAPLLVAGVIFFGFFISLFTLPRRMHAAAALEPIKQYGTVMMPFNFAAGLLLMTAFFVGVFYCLDALYGERRDRSILFWKSLPVSDSMTVLTKASVPLVVLPPFILVLVLFTHAVMLVMSSLVLAASGSGLATLTNNVKIVQSTVAFSYAIVIAALWYAPIFAWFLLVSGWARRAAIVWALMPALALMALDRIAFQSNYFYLLFGHRLTGWLTNGFAMHASGEAAMNPLMAMTPARFFTTPGLWVGLILTGVFLAVAVRQRRNRESL